MQRGSRILEKSVKQDLGNRFRRQKGPAQVHSLSGAGADYRQGLSLYRRERQAQNGEEERELEEM